MRKIYEVTKVIKTKNPAYARICGYCVDTGDTFNELYGKYEVNPLVVGDKVTLGHTKKVQSDGSLKYFTFVNKYAKE